MNRNPVRQDFPFFASPQAPIYLDTAATAQKPRCVIERISAFYTGENANIHRGGYPLAENATRSYEQARADIAFWLGISASQVAFTLNATDALNQAACMIAHKRIQPGCNVITTALEHHSALLPMMELCHRTQAELRILPVEADGTLQLDRLEQIADSHTAAAVITAASNSTGYRTPLEQILPFLRDKDIPVIVDATQRIVHEQLNMRALDCDFLCFSGHKLYGPMGIGVLAMREDWVQNSLGRLGGGMVEEVTAQGYVRIQDIHGLEAGTPPVAQALGLSCAIRYLQAHADALMHEGALAQRLRTGLCAIEGIRLVPAGDNPLPIVAFTSDVLHATDLVHLLSIRGFALRSGMHCAHIAHGQLGLGATLRASLGIYTDETDVDSLIDILRELHMKWRKRNG